MPCGYPVYRYVNPLNPDEIKWTDINTKSVVFRDGNVGFADKHAQKIPCGKCRGCMLDHAKMWSDRLLMEKAYYPADDCWFLTLTYNPEFVPVTTVIKTDPTTGECKTDDVLDLRPQDMTMFFKRLRHYIENHLPNYGQKVKYLYCGEYGSRTHRPHYHAIIFGLPLAQLFDDVKKVGNGSNGDPLWSSETFDSKLWRNGLVFFGQVTDKSCGYVARYTLKKAKPKERKEMLSLGLVPPYIRMSKGLSKRYYQDHKDDFLERDMSHYGDMQGSYTFYTPRRFKEWLLDEYPEEYRAHQDRSIEYSRRKEDMRFCQTSIDKMTYYESMNRKLEKNSKILLDRKDI